MATVQGLTQDDNDDEGDALIGTVNAAGAASGASDSGANTTSTAGGAPANTLSVGAAPKANQTSATLNQSGGDTSGGSAGNTAIAGGSPASVGGAASTNASSNNNPNTNAASAPNGGVVDISKYLSGNANQVSNLSNNVQNWLTTQGTNAQNTVNQNVGSFTNDVNAATVNENPSLVSQATSNPTAFVGNSTTANPNANLQSLLSEENATYTGPTQFETSQYYAPSSNAVNQATMYGNDIGSQTGLSAILQAMNPGSQPNSLDATLLGSTPQSQAALQAGQQATSGLNQYLADAAAKANVLATQAGQTTAQTAQTVQKAVSDAYNQFQSGVNTNVTNATNTATGNQTALQNALQSGTQLTPAQIAATGMTPSEYANLQQIQQQYKTQFGGDVPLSTFFTPASNLSTLINPNNVATSGDYATQNALSLENPNAGYGNFLTTPNAAGSAPSNIGTFNYQQAQTSLQNDITAGQQSAANRAAMQQAAQASQPDQSGNQIMQAVVAVVEVVAFIFCHYQDTQVIMEDGSRKTIQDIHQGDKVLDGGEVTFIGMWIPTFMFDYFGDIINGNHAVLEDSKWIRVKDSKHAKPVEIHEGLVYPMITKNHRIVTTNGYYADYLEVDKGLEMSDKDSLEQLNIGQIIENLEKKYAS